MRRPEPKCGCSFFGRPHESKKLIQIERIPSKLGTSAEGQPYAPHRGMYQDRVVYYYADGAVYLYDSDGDYVALNDSASTYTKDQLDEMLGEKSAVAVIGSGAPTSSTIAKNIGQPYYDTANQAWYLCSAITPQGTTPETYMYTWEKLATAEDISGLSGDVDALDDRVDNLEEQIEEVAELNTKFATVHYPYRGDNQGTAQVVVGDNCNAIIDFGNESSIGSLITYLKNHNILKFNYVFISHLDVDHTAGITGFEQLINDTDFDFSECTFVLPPRLDFSLFQGSRIADLQNYEEELNSFLTNKGYTIVYPTTEGQELICDDDNKFTIFNVNPSYYAGYYPVTEDGDTVYNNFSMVVKLNSCYSSFLFTGDIQKEAEANIKNSLGSINVLAIPHHGVNSDDLPSFIANIYPEIGVVMNTTNTVIQRPLFAYFADNNRSVYTSNESGNIIISAAKTGVEVKSTNGAYNLNANNAIPENADLNDYTQDGIYHSQSNSSSLTNGIPNYSSQLRLEVVSVTNTATYQFATTLNANTAIWVRKFVNNSWTNWNRLFPHQSCVYSVATFNSTANTNTNLPLNPTGTINNNSSVSFSLADANAGILVGKGVSKVTVNARISTQLTHGTATTPARIRLAILRNSSIYSQSEKMAVGNYETINSTAQFNVEEGDIIKIAVRNFSDSENIIIGSDYLSSVEVIDIS